MQREIGGYFELERFTLPMLHEDALALSSGRAALACLIERRGIRRIALPDFCCDVVRETCERCGVSVRLYPVGLDLRPAEMVAAEDEWFYLVNFYGQLKHEELEDWAARCPRLIVDNAQAYFDVPLKGVDTLYTCRKFLGVSDGGFLYTDAPGETLPRDESHGRMGFVLGRFERPAGEYYAEASGNNDALPILPVLGMSALTENLLHGIEYGRVRFRREENFARLHAALGEHNRLAVRAPAGPFAYPFLHPDAPALRRRLIAEKIFVPTLWPNVLREQPEGSAAHTLAENILPLPCDQRYGSEEMDRILEVLDPCSL